MKKFVTVLAVSMLATLSSAFAGTVYMDANDYASLPSCAGVVQTKIANYGSDLNLVFSNVAQCSNFDIVSANGDRVAYENQKLQGQNQSRYGSFTIPSRFIDYGRNEIRVSVKSNTGKHADTIVISVKKVTGYPVPTPSRTANIYMTSRDSRSLSACGGSVQTQVNNGDLNIVFRNVANCSNFDIVGKNGQSVNYPNKKLQGQNPNRNGSFTVPADMIRFGGNTIYVTVKSNSGQTSEVIAISFLAF